MTVNRKIKVVSRASRLSLLQVKEVFSLYNFFEYDLVATESFGDKNKHLSLMGNIDHDFFTREMDHALLSQEADIAIHSAKDLPYPLPTGLEVYCLTQTLDRTDSLVSRNSLKLSDLSFGAKVGTSSKMRKKQLENLRPDLVVVSVRGTIEERMSLIDKQEIDALIVATCALKRLGISNRIAEVLPFETHPLQGSLAIVGRADNLELKVFFSLYDVRATYGKVTLVGFGPGDPDLLTIAGDDALQHADIIFHDDLVKADFLHKYVGQKVYVGKRKDKHSYHQDEINELVYQAALSGKNVVRLKGGDPMIFAHGREEIDFLASRFIEVKVIPGISSAIALAAYTHIPLTHRGIASSVAFVTAHSVEELQTPNVDTLVYYMGGSNLSDIAEKLLADGRSPDLPVAMVCHISLPEQQTFFSTLGELRYSAFKYPTPLLVVVGKVVSFEYDKISNQKILMTGTVAHTLQSVGRITHTPLIKIEKIALGKYQKEMILDLETYDWIIFTSRYGVRFFFEILKERNLDIRKLASLRIGSVGKTTTAELGKYNVLPDLESKTESAEGLIAFFKEKKITYNRILLPRSDKGLKSFSDELEVLGNQVIDVPVYSTKINESAQKVDLSGFSKILFSSPSGVDAFKKIYNEFPDGIPLVGKGKTTGNKLKSGINEKI